MMNIKYKRVFVSCFLLCRTSMDSGKVSRLVFSRFLNMHQNFENVKEKPTGKTCFSRARAGVCVCGVCACLIYSTVKASPD